MDMNDAIAELQSGTVSTALQHPAVVTILNAVLSGQLIPLETCNARVAAMERERDDALTFLDNAISKAPEPLRTLGEWLADLLDEDDWATAERYLNAAVRATSDHTAALDAMISRAREVKPLPPRKSFPILKGEGAKIDFQLVADHAEQARNNHYQSVDRLAERGGLSWCELYAVLHNRKREKIDDNDAMIACRALEARYLAALRANATDASEGDR